METVQCDRGDGLGFDLLRAFIKANNWGLNYFILSKETNPVVSIRAAKLKVKCVQSISNKASYIAGYLSQQNLDSDGLIYLGNDLNDLGAMQAASFSVAPVDSHPNIIDEADLVLSTKGGDGFLREFIELMIGLKDMSPVSIIDLLESNKV